MIPKFGMQTYTGHFDLETFDGLNLEDIHYKLSRTFRFSGYNRVNFTVLDHSYFCLWLVENVSTDEQKTNEIKLATFIHDFAEAYVGDVVTPLKRLLKKNYGFDIGELEGKIIQKLLIDLNQDQDLYERNKSAVHHFDTLSLAYEKKYTLNKQEDWGRVLPETSDDVWKAWLYDENMGYADPQFDHFYSTIDRLCGGAGDWRYVLHTEFDWN